MYNKRKIKTVLDLNYEKTGLRQFNSYALIKTGLYGDKFASFLDSLFNAIRDAYIKETSQQRVVANAFQPEFVDMKWMSASSCYFFIDSIRIPNDFSKHLNKTEHVVKSQYGEVCLCRSQENTWSYKSPVQIKKMIARTIKSLTTMQCTFDHINSQLKDENNPFLDDDNKNYRKVWKKIVDVEGDKYIIFLNEEKLDDKNDSSFPRKYAKGVLIRNEKGQYICATNSPRYPYGKIVTSKLNEYWSPTSEKPSFVGNGFTCRDAYLAYSLLIGNSRKTLLKHYTQDEINEMVGKERDPVTAAAISTTLTELCLKRDSLIQKSKDLAQELADRIDCIYKKLVEDSRAKYREALNQYSKEYNEMQKAQLSSLQDFDIIYDDCNLMKEQTIGQTWLM